MAIQMNIPGWVMISIILMLPMNSVLAQTWVREILPDQIWIFDNNQRPVSNELSQLHPVKHFNLDQTKTFESQLSLGLSGSPQVAAKQALNRIQKLSTVQMERFKQSYTGIVSAFQMGVRQLPAIVFEYQGKHFVVYGQQQASRALQEFQQWQNNH